MTLAPAAVTALAPAAVTELEPLRMALHDLTAREREVAREVNR